ncbi:MAG: histidinol dehydrogenase, partial [Treponema sp.]|nr:histidinol dehydrogenase [Treponema sp.]
EVLGDYSAGINHTLPTSASARFTGGLSVRHFLKTVTTLRCSQSEGYEKARNAAEILSKAEGLEGHAQAAFSRRIESISLCSTTVGSHAQAACRRKTC